MSDTHTPARDLAIDARGLVQVFGTVRALDSVDLAVPTGSVFGFLGPNGAGKTTTLRILLDLLRPTSGTVQVLGGDPAEALHRMGFLPDVPGFYPWMTGAEFLRFAGSLFRLDRDVVAARVPALLDMAGLTGVRTQIGGYSRGMRQRLGIAQALINAPEVLLLDEPTSALDPLGRRDVLDMIESLRGRTTVLFSTHILADAERVCDHVAILDRGKVVDAGTVPALIERNAGSPRMRLAVDEPTDDLLSALLREPWAESIVRADGAGTWELTVTDQASARRGVPRVLAAHDAGLLRFEALDTSLEDVFLRLVAPHPDTITTSEDAA